MFFSPLSIFAEQSGSPTLLPTKLHIPRLSSRTTMRPRLLEALNGRENNALTLISAPAGSGKTTLLAQWLSRQSCPIAWLSLDSSDNAPERFFAYLAAALQLGGLLHDPLPVTTPIPEIFCTMLISRLSQQPTLTGILALDDYHMITNETLHQSLAFLIEHLPPHIRLIVATRTDPPIPLARLRAHGRVLEIRATDLRFDTPEITSFFHVARDQPLTPQETATLEERTEGWITGLQIIALTPGLQIAQNKEQQIALSGGSHRLVLDYLQEEVLSHLPTPLLTFLLQTSILEELSGPLCDAVTDRQDGQYMLEQIERANLFTIALDTERRWYRYHHLFAEMLNHRLEQTTPGHITVFHQRASQWYEEQGMILKAIKHAFNSKDTQSAAKLLSHSGEDLLFRQGQGTLLLHWLEHLPPSQIREHARLSCLMAYVQLQQGKDSVADWLYAAEQTLHTTSEPEQAHIQSQLAILHFMLATSSPDIAVAQAEELARQAREKISAHHPYGGNIIQFGLSKIYEYHGLESAAIQAYQEAAQDHEGHSNMSAQYALVRLAQLEERRGNLHQAHAAYHQALALARRYGEQYPATDSAMLGLANLLLERNELIQAENTINDYRKRYPENLPGEERGFGLFAQARLFAALSDDRATDMLKELETLARQQRLMHSQMLADVLYALLALQRDDIQAAHQRLQGYAEQVPVSFAFIKNSLLGTWLRIQIRDGEARQAESRLHMLLNERAQGKETPAPVELWMLLALASQALGQQKEALERLTHALELAESAGYVRLFVDEGPLMRDLLTQLPASSAQRRLLAAFPQPIRQVDTEIVSPLSVRELEVLRLIAKGASNQDIARELVITIHTVKRHVNNIFTKIAVTNRVQAIAYARERGWLKD